MKINTIPLQHSYNNNSCNRFWDGYFNYSGRQWVVLHSKDKEIQAVEIHDPRTHSNNALKILLLFTLIVPILAAIIHFIKMCNYRKYHVTLMTPQHKTSQIRQPHEEQATLTHLPEKEDKPILPLNADEAYEYILKNEVELNGDALKLLQNLEKITLKKVKWIHNLKDFHSKNFPNLKIMEVSYEDIDEVTLSMLIEYKKTLSLSFIGKTFEKNNSIATMIAHHGDDLISLLQDSPRSLLHLLFHSKSLPNIDESFNEALFKAFLTEEILSKLNEDELGVLFDDYGEFLNVKNSKNILERRGLLNLLEILPSFSLFPYIFKAKNDDKHLLNLLIKNNLEYSCQEIQALLISSPDLLESMFQKFKELGESNKAYILVFIAYISAGKIYNNPDDFLRLTTSGYPTTEVLKKILRSNSIEKASVDNLRALVLHKDVTKETRLKFFEEFSGESVTAKFILEFASDEENLKQLKKNCEETWSDSIFKYGIWGQNLKRDRRPFILLIRCLDSLKERGTAFTSTILKARPEVFWTSDTQHCSFQPLILAIEALYELELIQVFIDIANADCQKWARELALITPLEKLQHVPKLFLRMSSIQLNKRSIATVTSEFVTHVLNHREEDAIKKVLNQVLPTLYPYFHYEFQALKDLLKAFDSPKKLEYALDCIVAFPAKKKEVLLTLFSGGSEALVNQKELKFQIGLPAQTIKEIMDRRKLKISPNNKTYQIPLLK